MPAELMEVFGDSLFQPAAPATVAQALPETSAPEESAPAPSELGQQMQTVANAARMQAMGVAEMAGQLQQVARLIVQNSEDVQGAWAASQQLQQTARELDELVQYFD